MERQRAPRRLLVGMALLAVSAGCGGESEPEPTGPTRYGTEESSTTVTSAAADSSAVEARPGPGAGAAAPVEPAPLEPSVSEPTAAPTSPEGKPTVANRSERVDANGLELVLVVADKVQFSSNEDITLQLSYVNRREQTLYRYAAQERFFELVGEDRMWTTTACQPDFGGQRTPPAAIAIEPGEPNRFVGTYPSAPRSATREQCRLPAGEYDAYGVVDWCPPDTVTTPGGGGPACDPERVVAVRSAPLRITIT